MQRELSTLSDFGLMRVPWHRVNAGRAVPQYGRAWTDESDLAAHIAGGGQLVIVGPSQSGKTTLAVRLMSLLDKDPERQPVLFRLHTWMPRPNSLIPWMLSVLKDEYGLRGDAFDRAADSVKNRSIVPIFDGLDELPESCLTLVAQSLRQFIGSGPAVLTGIRTGRNKFAFGTALPGGHIISLDPVGDDEVSRYLLDEVPAEARDPWEAMLRSDEAAAAREALATPLNAWLAKAVYVGSGRGVDQVAEVLQTFRTPAHVEQHLLSEVVRAAFTRRAARPVSDGLPSPNSGLPDGDRAPVAEFVPEEAEVWLGFLSWKAKNKAIAFWELRGYAPLFRLALVVVVLLAAATALGANLLPIPPGSVLTFLTAGVVFGFGYARGYSTGRWRAPDDPTRLGYILATEEAIATDGARPRRRPHLPKDGDFRDHGRKLAKGSALIATFYVVSLAVGEASGRSDGWRLGLSERQFGAAGLMATVLALSVGYLGGRVSARVLRSNRSLDDGTGARASHPLEAIRNDLRSGIGMLVLAHLVLVAGFVIYQLLFHLPGGYWSLVAAPVGALAAVFFWNQWAPFKAAHLWLYLRDRLPLHLQHFLGACHRHGLLRQNGNHFTFRHQRLQDCLTAMYKSRLRDPAS